MEALLLAMSANKDGRRALLLGQAKKVPLVQHPVSGGGQAVAPRKAHKLGMKAAAPPVLLARNWDSNTILDSLSLDPEVLRLISHT